MPDPTGQTAARDGSSSSESVAGSRAASGRARRHRHARQGSIRAPHWRGGGVAHGPKPRDYRQRTPKKMIRLALRSALSDRASDEKIIVIDEWRFSEPRTKDAIEALRALGLRTKDERAPRVLLVLDRAEDEAWKSFRNLGERVQIVLPEELNVYDVLVNDWLVFSRPTLEGTIARLAPVADPAASPGETSTSSPESQGGVTDGP